MDEKREFDKVYFIGIDPSFSGTGVVILREDLTIEKQLLISSPNLKGIHEDERRMKDILNKLSFISNYGRFDEKEKNKCIITIEDISFGSRGQGSDQLAGLNYAIRLFLMDRDFDFYTVSPSKLKKFVTGVGNCKKNLMLKEVYKKWHVDYSDDNLCDAYSLARYSQSVFSNPETQQPKKKFRRTRKKNE